uniref:Uncharacterized protein n=1 Tax=Scleropages formosus TaxID=113540 RepID=A0A8C9S4Q0_SCLFO
SILSKMIMGTIAVNNCNSNSFKGYPICLHLQSASKNKSENFSRTVNSSILKPGSPVVSTLEEQQCNPETSLHQSNSPGRLIQSLVRHNQGFNHLYHTGRSSTHGNAKDVLVGLYPVRKASKTVSIVSLKKARKNGKMPSPPSGIPFYQTITKSDSNYDIVYVGKAITECKLQPQCHVPPRQNARKSTRGHVYFRDCWELKTVRTLSGKSYTNENGNYPVMMSQTNTLVTPIQLLSKPDSVPPVDVQFAGGCEEAISQKEPVEESMEREMVDEDMAGLGESSIMLESFQTGHAMINEQVSSATKALLSSINQQNSKTTEQEEAVLETEISAQNSVKSVDKENNQERSGPTQEKGEVQAVQLQETLSGPADITHNGSKSDILSIKESQNDITESIQRLPSVFITEHSVDIQGDDLENTYDKEVQSQSQKPLLVKNLAKNVEYTAGSKESGAKENANSPEKEGAELVCQAVGETGPQLHGLVSSGIVEKVTVKEFDIVFENSEEHCILKEVIMNTPGSITTKTESGRCVSASDRCLRSRTKISSSESLSKTQKQMKDPSKSNIGENFKMNSPLRAVSVKHQEAASPQLGVNHSEALEKSESLNYTVQPSSEIKPSDFHVDGPVWTRQKHKSILTKEMEKNEAVQGQLLAQRHDKRAISKMCTAAASMVTEDASNCDSMGGDMEISGKMSSDMFCRNGGMSTISVSSIIPLKQDFRPQRLVTPRPNDNEHRECHVKTRLQKCIQIQRKDSDPFGLQKLDLSGSNPHKFLETLMEEENQRLITNLNSKYDKMQRGWIQIDKAGQHTACRPKNKADRLKEIWKSKRRVRKPKSLDQPKFSPVRLLFTKTFDMSSICQWFLQTTETKSLVIVKKANTRLPSETQLCFQGSSGVASSSQGVFPSLQAERLKKHLKKFAIASPVKSNPKNRKLISQVVENQKATVGSRHPASARILRKYSNIRGKLQIQPQYIKPKGILEEDARLRLKTSPKPVPSPKLLQQKKKGLSVGKDCGSNKSKPVPSNRRLAGKTVCRKKGVKNNNRSSTGLNKKDDYGLRRSSLSSAAQKLSRVTPHESVSSRLKSKAVVPIKVEKEPVDVPKPLKKVQVREAKVQTKKLIRNIECLTPHQKVQVSPVSQDYVLTRSQRKIEATPNTSVLSKSSTKRTQDFVTSSAKRTRTSLLK